MKKPLLYIVLLLLVACEKQSNYPLSTQALDLLVVDGMITSEHKTHAIRLTRTVGELNAVAPKVSGANIILSDNVTAFLFHEQVDNPGVYLSPAGFFAKQDVEYTLLISVEGKTYTAKTFMVANGPLKKPTFIKNSSTNLYQLKWIENPYDAQHPAMFELLLDWSAVPGYTTLEPQTCKARIYYYTLPTLDVSEIFAPEIQQISFPLGTKVIERRYSLNPGYTEFIRAMISETNWKGGLFDSAPANVPTNLSQGAIGYFAACGVVSDSLIVQ